MRYTHDPVYAALLRSADPMAVYGALRYLDARHDAELRRRVQAAPRRRRRPLRLRLPWPSAPLIRLGRRQTAPPGP